MPAHFSRVFIVVNQLKGLSNTHTHRLANYIMAHDCPVVLRHPPLSHLSCLYQHLPSAVRFSNMQFICAAAAACLYMSIDNAFVCVCFETHVQSTITRSKKALVYIGISSLGVNFIVTNWMI